jgi:murein L,D-transpeptidase YcbB/YkuD
MKKFLTLSIVLLSGILLVQAAERKTVSSGFFAKKSMIPASPDHLVARLAKSTSSPFLPVLRWRDVSSNEDGFLVERKVGKDANSLFAVVGKVGINETSYTDATAYTSLLESSSTSDTSFFYRITAFNQYGSSTSNKAVVVAPAQNSSIEPVTGSSSLSSLFSHGDYSVLAKHLNTTIADVNTMIKQKGERVMSAVLNTAKAKVGSDACVDISKNLSKGSSASMTGKLQKFLIGKGFLPGEASGVYGDFTVEAVKAYQRSINLPETGMVNDVTRQAIKKETCQ